MDLIALLLRHGQTELNKRDVLKGLMDPPLDKEGIAQARAAARFLAKFPIERAITSPLLRAYHSMLIVEELTSVSPTQDRALFPWDLGTEFMDVPKKTSGLEQYVDDPSKTPKNGVSLANTQKRIHAYFSEELPKGVLTLFGTHNSVITTLADLLEGSKDRKKRHPEMNGIVMPGGVVGVFQNSSHYVMKPLFGELDDEKYASS